MKAIPCLLYVDISEDEVKEFLSKLDEGDTAIKNLGVILPDFSREINEVGSYNTPDGPVPYKAKLTLKYTDPNEVDPDTRPGDYNMEIMARNSLEAAERTLDRFHSEHPIDNLDAIEIDVQVTRADKSP